MLAAVGAKTKRIEIGTAVIDMRYENPLYMVEDAGAADLIAGGRLQLGISRGSPKQAIDGWRYFGYAPAEGETDADMGAASCRSLSRSYSKVGSPEPRPGVDVPPARSRHSRIRNACANASGGGAATNGTAEWAATLGMNLQSSTLKFDEGGEPFHIQQANQIRAFRAA